MSSYLFPGRISLQSNGVESCLCAGEHVPDDLLRQCNVWRRCIHAQSSFRPEHKRKIVCPCVLPQHMGTNADGKRAASPTQCTLAAPSCLYVRVMPGSSSMRACIDAYSPLITFSSTHHLTPCVHAAELKTPRPPPRLGPPPGLDAHCLLVWAHIPARAVPHGIASLAMICPAAAAVGSPAHWS